jgi:acyl dehydratase
VRFRRPVYNGDPLVVQRGPVERGAGGLMATVTVTNPIAGEVVVHGTIGLPDRTPEPPADLPLLPTFAPRLELRAGSAEAGMQLGSTGTVLDAGIVAESLADFHETEAIFAERGLVHSGCLIRKTMGDMLGNLVLPMPVIFAGAEVQHLAPVAVGAVCRTSSRITRVWESRGKHFFETEEWLVADGVPVARHLRQNLYAMTV